MGLRGLIHRKRGTKIAGIVPPVLAADFGKVAERTDRPGKWRVDCRPHGVLLSDRGVPFRNFAHAESVLASIRYRIVREDAASVVADFLPKHSRPNRVGTLVEAWLDHTDSRPELTALYKRELQRFGRKYMEPLHGLALTDLTFSVIDRWVRALPVAASTQRRVLAGFRVFLKWCRREGKLPVMPELPRISVAEHMPTLLTREQQAAVLAAIPAQIRGAFLAMCHGVRPSEVRALTMQDYSGETIIPRRAMKGPKADSPIGVNKNRTARPVSINVELATWVRTWRSAAIGDAPLFPNDKGQRWSGPALRSVWHKATKACGLKVGLYEGTKHSSASNALLEGKSLEEIQHALRHRDPASTRVYARWTGRSSVAPVSAPAEVATLLRDANLSDLKEIPRAPDTVAQAHSMFIGSTSTVVRTVEGSLVDSRRTARAARSRRSSDALRRRSWKR